MNIEQLTIIFLIAVFAAAEIYRATRGMRGSIIAVNDSGYGELLPVTSVKIRLDRGDLVDASLNCCTACLGKLRIGDEVRVCSSRDGYVVDLPWFRRGNCASGPDRENPSCKIHP
ncbi:MAG: hypothetical protein HY912_18855 [Desulfomonile tiedjei]|uniref:Uncharacterized protein n=1 Tax=Desulfomonile tiedjei TaxID=2358 RepID=A0A9D6V3S3_9BACT|nr:hypothetical protein [Desulfomonile tiedjei]